MDNEPITVNEILDLREQGQLESLLEDRPRYVLFAYRAYPNRTTGDQVEMNREMAAKIGQKLGIGVPTDPHGWAIWDVGSI